MLAYILALAVALGSLAIYLAAFFFPEIHRKSDFYWSGVGLFYALVLWVCAGRITGGVLLGQTASVALLGWFGWQTLTLRYSLTPPAQRTDVPSGNELQQKLVKLPFAEQLGGLFTNLKDKTQQTFSKVQQSKSKPEAEPTLVTSPSQVLKDAISDADKVEVTTTQTVDVSPAPEQKTETPPPAAEPSEPIHPNPPPPELVEAAIEDAEAKHIPASPPAVEEPKISDSAAPSQEQPKNPPEAT